MPNDLTQTLTGSLQSPPLSSSACAAPSFTAPLEPSLAWVDHSGARNSSSQRVPPEHGRHPKPQPQRSQAPRVDLGLLMVTLSLLTFGLIMVYSSSFIYAQTKIGQGYYFIRKQLIFSAVGCCAAAVAWRLIPLAWLQKQAHWAVKVATGLLFLVALPDVGVKVGGARRWLQWGGMTLQPGEFAKAAVIVFLAARLSQPSTLASSQAFTRFMSLMRPQAGGGGGGAAVAASRARAQWCWDGLWLAAILGLLLKQPDFGTTVMIALVSFLMLWLAEVPLVWLGGGLLLSGGAALGLVAGTAYRRARWLTFLHPWEDPTGKGFQMIQSWIGIHRGGLWGVGLGNGKEKLAYLPEAHNDFIFSVVAEELGFLGVLGVSLGYWYFIYRGLKVTWKAGERQQRFAMLLAFGITTSLGFQAILNMSVALGLLPTKGITLPFLSYGGSALILDLFMIGLLLQVSQAAGVVAAVPIRGSDNGACGPRVSSSA